MGLMVLCVRMICNINIDGNRKSTCSNAKEEQRGHVALLLTRCWLRVDSGVADGLAAMANGKGVVGLVDGEASIVSCTCTPLGPVLPTAASGTYQEIWWLGRLDEGRVDARGLASPVGRCRGFYRPQLG
jgi:hypothetical protein